MVLQVKDTYNITGRGLIYVVSLRENNLTADDIRVGTEVTLDGGSFEIRGIEAARQLTGVRDLVGLIVREK